MSRRGNKPLIAVLAVVIALAAVAIVAYMRRTRLPADVPPELVPPSWAEFRSSLGHESHVGKDKIVCKDCHDYEDAGFKSTPATVCVRCHEKQSQHGHGGGTKLGACLDCHPFAPDKVRPTCLSCHAKEQDHFAAVVTHNTTKCEDCHAPHGDPALVPKDCESCHKERSAKHAAHPDSKGCSDCHAPHQAAVLAKPPACSTCHENPSGPRPARHDSCLSCHKAHDFVAGGSDGCRRCHGQKPTLMAKTVAPHAVCLSCHTPHAPEQAAGSCVTCHATVRVAHGAGGGSCMACHKPHGTDVNRAAVTCTSCHSKIAPSDARSHAGAQSCTSCHKPHEFSPPKNRPALCASCHAAEATLTSTNKGHVACVSCHGTNVAHAPAKGAACASCHVSEASTAPAGHQKCANCHETHSGKTLPQAACATCHSNKVSGPHRALQGSCQSCHRAHGPGGVGAPPACVTCHAKASLPALHVTPGHANCASCHTSHGPPRADRAACTGACHVNRRDHQPQTQVCNGCHVFQH